MKPGKCVWKSIYFVPFIMFICIAIFKTSELNEITKAKMNAFDNCSTSEIDDIYHLCEGSEDGFCSVFCSNETRLEECIHQGRKKKSVLRMNTKEHESVIIKTIPPRKIRKFHSN